MTVGKRLVGNSSRKDDEKRVKVLSGSIAEMLE